MPEGLANATAAQKGAIKAAGRQIEQAWGRIGHAMKSWKNAEGKQWNINETLITEGHAYVYEGGKKKLFTS